jgi:hypothetical protein
MMMTGNEAPGKTHSAGSQRAHSPSSALDLGGRRLCQLPVDPAVDLFVSVELIDIREQIVERPTWWRRPSCPRQ